MTTLFLIIIATGLVFVILSGGIDLSVGSVVALTTMVAAGMLQKGANPIVVMVVVLLMGIVFGFAQGYIIQRFQLHPWIVTLAGLFFWPGDCVILSALNPLQSRIQCLPTSLTIRSC
ncbi:hypothetical protein GCM10020331_099440 [Ectobacillus funiculus]